VPIRRGSAAGTAAIAAVHVESWCSTYAALLPEDVIARHTPASRIRLWGHHLSGPDHRRCVFVAVEASGRVIGCASGAPSATASTIGQCYALYLLQSYQRCGFVQALLRALVRALIATA
jgi:hypothetical protein